MGGFRCSFLSTKGIPKVGSNMVLVDQGLVHKCTVGDQGCCKKGRKKGVKMTSFDHFWVPLFSGQI